MQRYYMSNHSFLIFPVLDMFCSEKTRDCSSFVNRLFHLICKTKKMFKYMDYQVQKSAFLGCQHTSVNNLTFFRVL